MRHKLQESVMLPAGKSMIEAGLTPSHPGGVFLRLFLEPRNISVESAALSMGVDTSMLLRFTAEQGRVTEKLADALAEFTGTSPSFWLSMQAARDLSDQLDKR